MTDYEILLFAGAAEAAKADRLSLRLGDDATAGELMSAIAGAYPALSPLLPSCRLAVDHCFVAPDFNLTPGAELALIPPVSGG